MILDVYNRFNIIGNGIGFPEYWKEEIQLIESFNPAYPWRHDLDELTNGDYIRVFGTQLLIQRLFLKALKIDDDWTAISNILNYSEVLDATERQKVFNYLKDPSKSNQEAWELYQASGVVAAYRFDQPLSLYNEDGSLCKLGWEGEQQLINGTFDSDITGAVMQAGTGGDATLSQETVSPITGTGSLKITQTTSPSEGYRPTITLTLTETPVVGEKFHVTFKTKVISGAVKTPIANGFYIGASGSSFAFKDHTFLGEETFDFVVESNGTAKSLFIYIDGTYATAFVMLIDDVVVTRVGDTVGKVLDVGSGGADGLTYLNLTQSDMSFQPKRVAGGIDCHGRGLLADKSITDSVDVAKFEIVVCLNWDGLVTNSYSKIWSKLSSGILGDLAIHYERKLLMQNGNGNFYSGGGTVPTNEFCVIKYKYLRSEQKEYLYINDALLAEQARLTDPSANSHDFMVGFHDNVSCNSSFVIKYFYINNL